MKRPPVKEVMAKAREAIRVVSPRAAGSGLSLDLRAALLNLDAALARALEANGNNTGAGANQLEVYTRLTTVRDIAAKEGPAASAAVRPIVSLLERRIARRTDTD
ncbi:MAG: hypothetical protein WD690_14365 [Vicinamibacterales bacterium]